MNQKVFAAMALISPLWSSLAQFAFSRYEGWGRWAAAPLLVLPLLYGLLIGTTGMVLVYAARRNREPISWWLCWSLVAFYPLWLLLLRRL